jgi:putative transposase
VLLRLAYLGVGNAFALLRLLPMSDRAKDIKILALRQGARRSAGIETDVAIIRPRAGLNTFS